MVDGGGGGQRPLFCCTVIGKKPASVYALVYTVNRHTSYILDPTANREIVVALSSSIKEFVASVKSETFYNRNLVVLLIVQKFTSVCSLHVRFTLCGRYKIKRYLF